MIGSIGSYLSGFNRCNLQFSWPPQDWELEFVVTLFDLLYSSLPSGQGGIECCGNLQKQKILLSVLSMMFEGFYRG